MEQTIETTTTTITENTENTEETQETNELIICPTCNKEQLKIITVSICEAKESIWYKCSVTQKCSLFQIKNKN
jgi:hypothetical protein